MTIQASQFVLYTNQKNMKNEIGSTNHPAARGQPMYAAMNAMEFESCQNFQSILKYIMWSHRDQAEENICS